MTTEADALKLLQDSVATGHYNMEKLQTLENYLNHLNVSIQHFSQYALWAEIFAGGALVCSVLALLYAGRAVKLLREPLPPLPKIARIPPPSEEFSTAVPREYTKPRDQDILAGLARELELA